MTTIIHPHWDSTDGHATVEPRTQTSSRSAKPAHVSIAVPSGSRRPAAVMGVLAVIAVGFVAVNTIREYTAQVAPVPVIVRLSVAGATPKNFSVIPGQPVTWKNADTVDRHISTDLPTSSGAIAGLLIRTGSSATVTVALNAAPGTYMYSDDDQANAILGKITIQQPAGSASSTPIAAGSSSSAPASANPSPLNASGAIAATSGSSSSIATIALSASSTSAASAVSLTSSPSLSITSAASSVSSSAEPSITLIASASSSSQAEILHNAAPAASVTLPPPARDTIISGAIDRNPHTVGAAGAPSARLPILPRAPAATTETFHGGAPLIRHYTTTSVPSTGPALWMLGGMTLGGFWLATRSAFKNEG